MTRYIPLPSLRVSIFIFPGLFSFTGNAYRIGENGRKKARKKRNDDITFIYFSRTRKDRSQDFHYVSKVMKATENCSVIFYKDFSNDENWKALRHLGAWVKCPGDFRGRSIVDVSWSNRAE